MLQPISLLVEWLFFKLTSALTSTVLSQTDTSSETEEELILTPVPRHHNHSLHAKEYHCICECPRRPENTGRVTLRSRSLSPSRRPKSATPSVKPPFKAGKADEKIISRRDFLNPGRSRLRSRAMPLEGDPGKNGRRCRWIKHLLFYVSLEIKNMTIYYLGAQSSKFVI